MTLPRLNITYWCLSCPGKRWYDSYHSYFLEGRKHFYFQTCHFFVVIAVSMDYMDQ